MQFLTSFKKTSLNNFKAFTYYELVKEPLHRDEAVSKLLAEVGHRWARQLGGDHKMTNLDQHIHGVTKTQRKWTMVIICTNQLRGGREGRTKGCGGGANIWLAVTAFGPHPSAEIAGVSITFLDVSIQNFAFGSWKLSIGLNKTWTKILFFSVHLQGIKSICKVDVTL